MLKNKKILFQLTGSIACYKACELISLLQKLNCEVRVVCSSNALKFIGKATLEGLTGHKVYSDSFEESEMMSHISLTRWCDLSIIYPASANSINKLAAGMAEDLIGNINLALPKTTPKFIAPAMNTKMLENIATKASLNTLSKSGYIVLPTTSGILACNEEGLGKLLSPEETLQLLIEFFCNTPKSILVTGGGTSETIDGVRSITNFSTGKTSASIINYLVLKGHAVTSVLPESNTLDIFSGKRLTYSNANSLNDVLCTELSLHNYDFIIHAAAVSDFTVESVLLNDIPHTPNTALKISSDQNVNLKLKPTPKILNRLKSYSINSQVKVIGFKLTKGLSPSEEVEKVNKVFAAGLVDFVIHNDLSEITDNEHPFTIYSQNMSVVKQGYNKLMLNYSLNQLFKELSQNINFHSEVTL